MDEVRYDQEPVGRASSITRRLRRHLQPDIVLNGDFSRKGSDVVHEEVIRWSAWPAMVCYFVATGLRLVNGNARREWYCRVFWIVGWWALLVHVVLAFVLFHGASWQAAYDHTARATLAATGWNSGAGLWFNIVTLLVWGADVLIRQPSATFPHFFRSRWDLCCQLYLAFMLFNATVVFGSPAARVAGCLGFGYLMLLAIRRW